MSRPRIKIKLEPIDIFIEVIGALGLILLIGLPIYYMPQLPDIIPTHFSLDGNPDQFKEKGKIWTLPIIGTVVYFGLLWINRFPHLFNYLQEVTMDNAGKLYKRGTRLIRTLNAMVILLFSYITYASIQTALGRQSGLDIWFVSGFTFLMMAVTGYFIYKMMSTKSH